MVEINKRISNYISMWRKGIRKEREYFFLPKTSYWENSLKALENPFFNNEY
jgi:hypothetical protein